ncbi:MAG: mechanosensitive ion channel protein [Desulfobulbus propionicus]|nr:MAG: mechanosensitive ion channel protein [Desulfobulbus propionicus]
MRFITRWAVYVCSTIIIFPSRLSYAANGSPASRIESVIHQVLVPAIAFFSANQWVQGLCVVLITFILASLTTWILFRILKRVTTKTTITLDDHIVRLLQPAIYYLLVAAGISAGITLMPLSEQTHMVLHRTIRTLTVFVYVIFSIRLSSLVLQRLAILRNRYTFIQPRTVTVFNNIAKVIVFGAGLYCVFVIWNIDMTAWLASAGIAGIAVGFAAKDTLSNLFSGVFIIVDAPYKVGDYVVLDKIGRGKVTSIGLRSTRILTRDDIEVTVPNSIIGNTTIINQSGGPYEKMRIRLPIGVAYGSDIDKVTGILNTIANNDPQVCRIPQPRVRFRVFGPSSLDFELLFWVRKPEERGKVVHAMNTKIYKKFNEEKIEIPYTKQDIYIKGLPRNTDDH